MTRYLISFGDGAMDHLPDEEMPDKPAALRFTIGAAGVATALTAESVDDNGLGTLARVAP